MAVFGGKSVGQLLFTPTGQSEPVNTVKPVIRTIYSKSQTHFHLMSVLLFLYLKASRSRRATGSLLDTNSVQIFHNTTVGPYLTWKVLTLNEERQNRVSRSEREGNQYFRQLLVAMEKLREAAVCCTSAEVGWPVFFFFFASLKTNKTSCWKQTAHWKMTILESHICALF